MYRARDPDLEQDIALKLYHQHRSRGAEKDELLSEARKLARVRHPNVVRVYGAEEHDGRVGVWMELIEGKTLEAEVKDRGTFDADTATDIGMAVCDALSQVHAAGLAHGDITARNVMREGDGRVVLTDFGAARFRAPGTSESSRGLAGTPAYLAPERFDRPEPTVQSDLYSVGVLLFYLVTGEYPVRGRSAKELRAAHGSSASMVTLQSLNPDLPDQFARVVERALARSPEHRCLTAAEMRQELHESKPTVERRITLTTIVPVLAAMGAAAIAIVALGFVAWRGFELWFRVDPEFFVPPAAYPLKGVQTLVPYVVLWIGGGTALMGLRLVLRLRRFAGTFDAIATRWRSSPKDTAAAVFFLGVACWIVLTWTHWDIWEAMELVRLGQPGSADDLSALDHRFESRHIAYSVFTAFLSLLLWVAAFRWFPPLEQQVGNARTVRAFKWLTIGLAFVAVAQVAIARRVLYERFEVVDLGGRIAYVVGQNTDELLLFDPRTIERSPWRVNRGDPRVVRTGARRYLFDTQNARR